jgi:hypothetical protein
MSIKSNREPKSNYLPRPLRSQTKLHNDYADSNNEIVGNSDIDDDDDADVKCGNSLANFNSPTLVSSTSMPRLKSANKYDADYENRYRKSINSLLKSVDFNHVNKNLLTRTSSSSFPISPTSNSYSKKSTKLINNQKNELSKYNQTHTATIANQRWSVLRKVTKLTEFALFYF